MTLTDRIIAEVLPKDSTVQGYLPQIRTCMERLAWEAHLAAQRGMVNVGHEAVIFAEWLNMTVGDEKTGTALLNSEED